jgi:DNA invertase Pin-like site-specific DNA recombinase
MSKIDTHHLVRTAYIYVRQSTMAQVQHNQESQRRQYGLRERARVLGWRDVTVVDDDLGRSGGGVARPGFDRLLTAVGRGEVGAVFAIEASRLARNGARLAHSTGILRHRRHLDHRRGWHLRSTLKQ